MKECHCLFHLGQVLQIHHKGVIAMTEFRGTKTGLNNHSKPSRFLMEAGKWYFNTREGGVEGPFDFLHEAEKHLDAYVHMFASSFPSPSRPLELQPLEMRWR